MIDKVMDAHDSSEAFFQTRRSCCCCFPCFERNSSSVGLKLWQKTRTSEIESSSGGSLWSTALKKIREWSEIVAGPKWKTFIRRFNRNNNNNNNNNKHANFQYDPLSYAMNFDEGPGQNGHFDAEDQEEEEEDEDEYYYYGRNFSSKYAKGSMDLGK